MAWWLVLGAVGGLLAADLLLRLRGWWIVFCCAFCASRPEDYEPWRRWRKGVDGLYRCPECFDLPGTAEDPAPVPPIFEEYDERPDD